MSKASNNATEAEARAKYRRAYVTILKTHLLGYATSGSKRSSPTLSATTLRCTCTRAGAGLRAATTTVCRPARPDALTSIQLQRRRHANCAGSCSTQPTASRARSRRPPAPLCPPVSPARVSFPERERDSLTQNPYQSSEAKQSARRRKRNGASSQIHQGERVPRLCRTYSVIPPHTPRTPRPRRVQTAVETYSQYTEQPLFHGPRRRKLKMMDKSTQTPPLRCPPASTKVNSELEQPKASAKIPYSCRPGTTDCVTKQKYRRTTQPSALFKDDLIEIIAEQSEKQLRCIYRSPGRADSCSTFNLVTNYRTKYHTMRGKKKPWR